MQNVGHFVHWGLNVLRYIVVITQNTKQAIDENITDTLFLP